MRNQFSHSNSYCESTAQFIPELNLCIINVYRPPGCPLPKFQETLGLLEDFLEGLEDNQGTPSILCTGDMNLPFVRDWSQPALEKFCTQVAEQETSTRTTAEDKRQAVSLIKFAQEHYMEQFINTGTRLDNILDLVFCSDASLILDCKQLVNNRSFSDHNSLFIQLSYGLKFMEQHKRTNHAFTAIPEYDLGGGDAEDWTRMNLLLEEINWEEEMENKSVQQMTDLLLAHLEANVKLVFKKKGPEEIEKEKEKDQPDKEDAETNTKTKISNNHIPKNVRKLFKQKKNMTQRIMKTTSASKCLSLKKKIETIEEQLKESYIERRKNQENKAISMIKKNPKAFYAYAKEVL